MKRQKEGLVPDIVDMRALGTIPPPLVAISDVVLAYRPKSKQPKPKKRKKAKRGN